MGNPMMNNMAAYNKFVNGHNINTSQAATVNGTGFSRKGYNSCLLHAKLGAVSGTPDATSAIFKLQQSSDDGSTDAYADISGATFTLTAANTENDVAVNLAGCEEYIRSVLVLSFTNGSTPSAYYDSDVVLGGPDTRPAA